MLLVCYTIIVTQKHNIQTKINKNRQGFLLIKKIEIMGNVDIFFAKDYNSKYAKTERKKCKHMVTFMEIVNEWRHRNKCPH